MKSLLVSFLVVSGIAGYGMYDCLMLRRALAQERENSKFYRESSEFYGGLLWRCLEEVEKSKDPQGLFLPEQDEDKRL